MGIILIADRTLSRTTVAVAPSLVALGPLWMKPPQRVSCGAMFQFFHLVDSPRRVRQESEVQYLSQEQKTFIEHAIRRWQFIETNRREKLGICSEPLRARTRQQIEICEKLIEDLQHFSDGKIRTDAFIRLAANSCFSERINAIFESIKVQYPNASEYLGPYWGSLIPSRLQFCEKDLLKCAANLDSVFVVRENGAIYRSSTTSAHGHSSSTASDVLDMDDLLAPISDAVPVPATTLHRRHAHSDLVGDF